MSDETAAREAMMTKTIVYSLPGMEEVTVHRDNTYRTASTGNPLTFDVYTPSGIAASGVVPAVLVAQGYPDPTGGFKRVGWNVSWARLLACSGIAALLYSNEASDSDALAMFDHLSASAGTWQIDPSRIGVLSASANVPVALHLLMERPAAACATLVSGFMIGPADSTVVADAARQYGFVNATAGQSANQLRSDMPLFVIRAGQDQFPGINGSIDEFLRQALAANLPVTFMNVADGPHAFDLFVDTDATRRIIKQIVAFFRFHLGLDR
jgi:hypothetical protein